MKPSTLKAQMEVGKDGQVVIILFPQNREQESLLQILTTGKVGYDLRWRTLEDKPGDA